MRAIENRMPTAQYEFEVKGKLQALAAEIGEVKTMLGEVLKRIPPPQQSGEIEFNFVRQEEVDRIRKQKGSNKNLFALALEQKVYADLQSDLLLPVDERTSTDRVQFIKDCVFKYYQVPQNHQLDVWRSVRESLNSRTRRERKALRDSGRSQNSNNAEATASNNNENYVDPYDADFIGE
ncbi:hypothetical protein OESDEN_11711 [Oesophagostomum dentatum]|uniref:Uncharacterized protein n=1 Tax=Oesophagostomum dentatum TaxID=61180 RepID=A0A0B1ST50_OESDE|nr:hypothetical protein OESDEN_11711 [Oesophagostomum dentatum]